MSLITRCPACATLFKVVPDQLKLSDGWVRCGHCSDVFDATRYLENWALGAAEQPPSGGRQASPGSETEKPIAPHELVHQAAGVESVAPLQQAARESAFPFDADAVPAPLHVDENELALALEEPELPPDNNRSQFSEASPSITRGLGEPAPEHDDRDTGEASDFHTELKRFAEGLGKPLASDLEATSAGAAVSSPAKVSVPAETQAVQQTEEELEQLSDREAAGLEPSFVRQARRRAFWRSPGVRVLLTLVALLLSVLLATQWALHERNRLAARHPDWRPLLASLCEPLGCRIGAVRDIHAVVIDSSTLTRRIGDFYSFDLVLKNNAAMPLAVPALELSLTDTADTVISRRVFLPEELPGVPPLLPPQSTVPVSLRLALAVGSDLPMTGYRALVFYP